MDLLYFCVLCKPIGAQVYFWVFHPDPLFYISVFVSVPYCLDDCSFVIQCKVRKVDSYSSIFLSQDYFCHLGSLVFPYGSPGGSAERIHLQCRRPEFGRWVRKIPWRREQQPTPVFLPRRFQRQRSLVGYRPWGCEESDTAKILIVISHFIEITVSSLFKSF